MATSAVHGVLLSQTSPAFLHANSTSHTWAFSAVAELIDNAYDPDVAAQSMWIDKKQIYGEICLIFMDNGAGLDTDRLHRMLSFGYCDKVEIKGHKPVGHYGNGFKSGSMRLGKDALVFSKKARSWSVGFLSQTYLKDIGSETVLVPIVSWDPKTRTIVPRTDAKGSLKAITRHSLFKSELELLMEFEALSKFQTGTRIIIYNLKRESDGKLELDLESNPYDIINSEHQLLDSNMGTAYRPVRDYIPEYKRSLREYCSILFLKPRMKIFLRNKKVKTKLISKSLSNTETDSYKPMWNPNPIKIVFGFSTTGSDYGVLMYHRNRLIKAYQKVGIQKQQNGQGKQVVGIVEVDFLEPIHNKQDFNKTDKYNACMSALVLKLNDYWNEKTNQGDASNPVQIKPDWEWAQCDNCLKWRRLPDSVDSDSLPDKWYCHMNKDATHNRCDVPEEPEDEDWVLQKGASYKKIYKQQSIKEKEKMRLSLEDRRRQLEEKERELKKMQQHLVTGMAASKQTTGMSKEALEKARRDLNEAQKRELQQKQVIQRLQQEKLQAERQQQMLKRTVEQVVSNAQAGPPVSKRKPENGATSAKRLKLVDVDENFVVEENSSDSDDDAQPAASESSKKPGGGGGGLLKVKWSPPKKKKSGQPIVIDSGSESESDNRAASPVDTKPDVAALDKAVNTKACDTVSTATAASEEASNGNAVAGTSKTAATGPDKCVSSDTAAGANLIASSVAHKLIQTDPVNISLEDSEDTKEDCGGDAVKLQTDLEKTSATLKSLRLHVCDLLKTILPNLSVDNIEDIDKLVVEMVRVNSEDGNVTQMLSPIKGSLSS